MPSFVIAEKCDGCKGGDKTACMYICPNDLMVLDPNQIGVKRTSVAPHCSRQFWRSTTAMRPFLSTLPNGSCVAGRPMLTRFRCNRPLERENVWADTALACREDIGEDLRRCASVCRGRRTR